MKVLYDASLLGVGHYYPTGRTGIFRVIENLAYGLKNSNHCDLNLIFCTSGATSRLDDFLDYLESNPELTGVPLAYRDEDWKFKRSLLKIQRKLSLKIDETSGSREILLKVFRKFLHYTARGVELFPRKIAPKIFAETDIYHSPFEAIPEEIRKAIHIKKFLTVHDLIPILHPELFKFNENTNLERALGSLEPQSWVLCVSQSTKNDLCNYSSVVDPDRVFVTHLAASKLFYPELDTQRLELVKSKYHIPNAPYILSLSTLEPRKNIDHTIRCFIKLVQQENIQDLYLVLVGTKGWKYEKIFAEISKNSAVKDKIIVTGFVADEDLAAVYSGALAFIYPSFYEGFGLPPLEAMQCGVPAITSNTSSLPEVVGDAGIMLDPKDVDGLCHSMFELYNKPFLRQSMTDKSLEQAKKFSWDSCAQQTIAAYKTALSA